MRSLLFGCALAFLPALAQASSQSAPAAPSEPPTEPGASTPDEPPSEPTAPPPAPTPTEAPASSSRVDALVERIDALERQVAELRSTKAKATTDVVDAPKRASTPETGTKAGKRAGAGDSPDNRLPSYAEGFHFGSYGRVVAGGDHRGRAGRDADIVAFGSRLDETTYAELELRREDYWEETGAYTRIVATVAFEHPIFHYDARFDARLGVRNLYLEESGLGLKNLKVWAGSRMYRGDDIYLLNFWPLDNLNTVGGGASYEFIPNLILRLHTGVNQPNHPFFLQDSQRPRPLAQIGATNVRITDRQKVISSAKLSHIFGIGTGGVKPVVYGELHYTASGQREQETQRYEHLPKDIGYVVGTQLGLFTGKRSTHVNLVFRYAGGLGAYGEFNAPSRLSTERTSKGARELLGALSGNYEIGPFGVLVGAYVRSFRNASAALDVDDVDEGIVVARPTVWFGKIAGLSLEGSYQAQRRGVLVDTADGQRPQFGQVGRFGVVPFLTPAGRGSYARPHIRAIYVLSVRDAGARRLYPQDDVFALRKVDHFFGLGAEWWFGSTSYFRD